MNKRAIRALCLFAVIGIHVHGTPIPVGFISWDVTTPGSTGQFDIANETGPNSSGDQTAPVSTTLPFTDLNLQITFIDGSSKSFGPAEFSLNVFDGMSWESPVIQIGGINPQPKKATLTGTFGANAITLFDSSQLKIDTSFSASIPDTGTALSDGDIAVIYAAAGTNSSTTAPEPASLIICATGMLLLLLHLLHRSAKRRMLCLF